MDGYVILTGSKNNAGDFLIKYRAKKLFATLRPDREVIDLDSWRSFDSNSLELVNNSKALILLGGPSLQSHMYPGIYPLTPNLDDIKVPITTMGVGWKSINGDWRDSYDYSLSPDSLKLLEKAHSSGLPLSVRDFHSQNTLAFHGYDNVLMTGCPAYYDLSSMQEEFTPPKVINKVAFSLGVSFIESPSMEKQMKSQILRLKECFKDSVFEVVFHHSLSPDVFMNTHGAKIKHNRRHNRFAQWLESQGVSYVDISGSAEGLIEYYSGVDLHVGYRVHAHIFMNSISKMSILIAEDGRGKAVEKVIGGLVVEGYEFFKDGFVNKLLNKVFNGYDRYKVNNSSTQEVEKKIDYEIVSNGQRGKEAKVLISNNYEVMKGYIRNLP